jgi:hypothetical protein
MISGAPLTFKTTSSLSWPGGPRWDGEPKSMIHVSLPGEKGWETVPLSATVPEITPDGGLYQMLWEEEDVTKTSPHAIIRAVQDGIGNAVGKALKEWKGRRWSLVIEGLHKMYGWHYQARFRDLQEGSAYKKDPDDDKISGRAFGLAHDSYQGWVHQVLSWPIPYVLGTIWEGSTKDDPSNLSKNSPSHIFPDLPGMMAKRIVGEFTVVLYSEVSLPDPKGRQRGKWTVKPQGKIWGVGVHLPPEIAAKVPSTIEPPPGQMREVHFTDLEPHLSDIAAVSKLVVVPEPIAQLAGSLTKK